MIICITDDSALTSSETESRSRKTSGASSEKDWQEKRRDRKDRKNRKQTSDQESSRPSSRHSLYSRNKWNNEEDSSNELF